MSTPRHPPDVFCPSVSPYARLNFLTPDSDGSENKLITSYRYVNEQKNKHTLCVHAHINTNTHGETHPVPLANLDMFFSRLQCPIGEALINVFLSQSPGEWPYGRRYDGLPYIAAGSVMAWAPGTVLLRQS